MEEKDKLPAHIRKEIIDAADHLEMLAESSLYEHDNAKFLDQFRKFCVKVTALYSIEAGTYIMKYVWASKSRLTDMTVKNYEKIIYCKEWKLFCEKCGDFVLHGIPPGFHDMVEIFRKRMEERKIS